MYERITLKRGIAYVAATLAILAFIGGITCALVFGIPAVGRYNARHGAANQVKVNALIIQQTQQLVEVERQKAAVRVAEAEGISKAQEIINKTLTDRYLQHEAIKAQSEMADSPNHTQVYIPVGTNGIPLVKTVDPDGAPSTDE